MNKKIPVSNVLNFHPELKDMDESTFIERKAISADLSQEKEGTILVIASTPAIDHDGDIIDPLNIKTDFFNGSVIWNHDLGQLPIGVSEEQIVGEQGMIAKIKFSDTYDFALDIANLCREGILKAVSIGFIPTKVLKVGTAAFDAYAKMKNWSTVGVKRIIAECQLIEISLCNVGCNSQALLIAAKNFKSDLACKNLKLDPEEVNKTEEVKEDANDNTVREDIAPESTDTPVPLDIPAVVPELVPETVEEIVGSKEETQETEKPEDTTPAVEEVKKPFIKFTDLGTKRSQMTDLTIKAFKTYKGLPI